MIPRIALPSPLALLLITYISHARAQSDCICTSVISGTSETMTFADTNICSILSLDTACTGLESAATSGAADVYVVHNSASINWGALVINGPTATFTSSITSLPSADELASLIAEYGAGFLSSLTEGLAVTITGGVGATTPATTAVTTTTALTTLGTVVTSAASATQSTTLSVPTPSYVTSGFVTSTTTLSSTTTTTSTSTSTSTSVSISVPAVSSASTLSMSVLSSSPTTFTTSTSTTTTSTSTTTTLSTSTSTSTATTSTAVSSSGKRGLAYNNASLTDLFSTSSSSTNTKRCYNASRRKRSTATSNVTWAYNWYSAETSSDFNSALTYIPMLWSNASDLTSVWAANVASSVAAHGSDALLAFNEPDGCAYGQACMDLASSVAAYQTYMQPYAGQLSLGSPAVTNAGAPDGLTYLSNFLSECTDCTIDFIALHWYDSYSNTAYFKSYISGAYAQFGLPIWLTEFGTTDGTDDEINGFLEEVLPWLDAQEYVVRYAFFWDAPGILVNSDGTALSELGETYESYA